MQLTWETLAYLMEFLVIGVSLYASREMIASKIYGIRYKRWQEIDTGRCGYVITDNGLTSCTINNRKKSICRANIKNNVLYFVSDVAENLKVEDARDKYQFYMNSEEFDTVYKNKLLQTLMLSLQNNYLLMIFVLVIISLAASGYMIYNMENDRERLNLVINTLNTMKGGMQP